MSARCCASPRRLPNRNNDAIMNKTALFFAQVDPEWAWQVWTPAADEPWDARRAAHLLRRATFGAPPAMLRETLAASPHEALERLCTPRVDDTFERESAALASSAIATGDARQLPPWWLHRMMHSPSPLLEKLTVFWHGHFATSGEKVKDPYLMVDQNRLLRAHALGDFSALVQAVSKDPAMLVYLDSAVNRKAHPNENYARELMELFCLGEGHYSERDVQELARCFTGWEIRRNAFRFNSYQHDAGEKRLLDRDGVTTGEQAVETVLESPQAPLFIVSKLFRYFIADEPAPPPALLAPLADELRQSGWQIAAVVRRMLGSRLMFSPAVVGRKIRSPLEFSLGWLKILDASTNWKKLAELVAAQGQAVFFPPNVKGWDGGRAWINSSTLVARANLLPSVLREGATRFAGGDLESYFRKQNVGTGAQLVEWLQNHVVAVPLAKPACAQLVAAFDQASGASRYSDPLVLAASLPELQLA
jgi:uncharacterized protein (DUF1800 family)